MPTFPNFSTPHCHPQSLDTASLPEKFIQREVELGTGTITATDHGSMGACRQIYKLAKKSGLTPILGHEGYFRDQNDPVLNSLDIKPGEDGTHNWYWTEKKDPKYAHFTMHAQNQTAYEAMVKALSKAHDRLEKHGSELKPLMDWSVLEELGGYDITLASGCLIGLVQRHLLIHDDPSICEAYYQKMRSTVKPGSFFVELFPHICNSKNDSGLILVYEDGAEEVLKSHKQLKFKPDASNKDVTFKMEELVRAFARNDKMKGAELIARMDDRAWVDLEPKKIVNAYEKSGLLMNPCRPWSPNGDYQLGANKMMLYFAEKYGDPVIISDDSHMAYPEDKVIQDIRLGNWSFTNSYHRFSSDEAFAYFNSQMGIDEKQFSQWIDNNRMWADKFKNFEFKDRKELPTKFFPEDTLAHTRELIEKHGRMDWNNSVYTDRLQKEIELFYNNDTVDLLPYFFIDELVCDEAVRRGVMPGPGRGSAGGVLLAYLMGITHIDPIEEDLSLDRFMTPDRIEQGKFPDIDQDLEEREWLLDSEKGFLKQIFGEHVYQLSVDTSLKLRSSIRDVARVKGNGKIPYDIEKIASVVKVAPQGISDKEFVFGYKSPDGWVSGTLEEKNADGSPNKEFDADLSRYTRVYPDHWKLVQGLLGLVRGKGRHASAYAFANRPLSDFMPITRVSDVPVTQYTAASVEESGALKMDFLGVNSLKDVRLAIKLIQERNGVKRQDIILDKRLVRGISVVPLNGQLYDVYRLPEDQRVFEDICAGRTATVFQLDTPQALKGLKYFNFRKPDGNLGISSTKDLAVFVALDRPGPLDYFFKDAKGNPLHNVLVEYTRRARGDIPVGNLPILDQMLPETKGILVFQENLTKVFREIGDTTGIQAENFRLHVGKKQMMEVYKDRDLFMPNAEKLLGPQVANELFQSLQTFANYGFCKAHAVAYGGRLSYACAFLKHYYPLEWWTAVLSNATKNEIDEKFWIHAGHLIALPDVSKSGQEFIIEGEKIRAPLSLLHGVGEKAHQQLCAGAPYTSIDDFCQKIERYKTDNAKKTEKGTVRKATSALNERVCYNLILSGAMDSLFPAEATSLDKLSAFEAAKAKATGRKSAEAVDDFYVQLNDLQLYQVRKKVLPAYTQPNLTGLLSTYRKNIVNMNGEWFLERKDDRLRFIDFGELTYLDSLSMGTADVPQAVAAYVSLDTRQSWNDKKTGKQKTMAKLTLDLGDGRIEIVQWPDKYGKLPPACQSNLTGSVIVGVVNKYSVDKPYSLSDIDVVSKPLGDKKNAKDDQRDPS